MREKTVEWALKEKIIAIVRGMEAKDCLRVAQALYDGGIRLMEITYDQRDPAQWAKTADAIGKIAEAFEGRMLVGAGTVTTPELVTRTRDAGGQFIISPDTNPAVSARTRELELVSMPGAMTPSEILAAHAAGADLVKLFPAAALGSAYLQAVRSPISHVRIMANSIVGVLEQIIRYRPAGLGQLVLPLVQQLPEISRHVSFLSYFFPGIRVCSAAHGADTFAWTLS